MLTLGILLFSNSNHEFGVKKVVKIIPAYRDRENIEASDLKANLSGMVSSKFKTFVETFFFFGLSQSVIRQLGGAGSSLPWS